MYKTSFENEVGNLIHLTVTAVGSEITVLVVGPTSKCEHTYTKEEAFQLLVGIFKVI